MLSIEKRVDNRILLYFSLDSTCLLAGNLCNYSKNKKTSKSSTGYLSAIDSNRVQQIKVGITEIVKDYKSIVDDKSFNISLLYFSTIEWNGFQRVYCV